MPVRRPVWLLLLAISACTVEPTQLVVVLDSDLNVPAEIDALSVDVTGTGVHWAAPELPLDGPDAISLSASFGLAPKGGDARRRVSVRLAGLRAGEEIVSTLARTSFVEHRRLRLDLFLARSCVGISAQCEEQGQTCVDGDCVDPFRDPDDLPHWDGDPATDRDAGPGDEDAGVDGGTGCPPDEPGPGIVAWARDPAAAVTTTDAALDAGGDAVVVGTVLGPVGFADGACALEPGVFVARVAASGEVPWVRLLTGPDASVGHPRVAIDPDGTSILVAFDLRAGTVVIDETPYEGSFDGVLVRMDRDGADPRVVLIHTDQRWEVAELTTDSSWIALVGTAAGMIAYGVDGGTAVFGPTSDLAVAFRWDADLSGARLVSVAADGGSEATGATLYGDGALAILGTWSGTLFYQGVTPGNLGPYFTVSVDDLGAATWPGPAVSSEPLLARRSCAFGPGGGAVLHIAHEEDGDASLYSLQRDGSLGRANLLRLGADRRFTDVARAGDAAAVLVGWTDEGGGFVARLDAALDWSWGPQDLEVAVSAVASSADGDEVLLAGDLEGTAWLDGVGDLGVAGLKQVYAVRVAPPQ